MAVDFTLLKNTFRAGETNPTQEELSNLAEFIRMIGTSSKFAMKAHYELSGKNNDDYNSSACEIEGSSDEDWVYDEDHQQWFKIKS